MCICEVLLVIFVMSHVINSRINVPRREKDLASVTLEIKVYGLVTFVHGDSPELRGRDCEYSFSFSIHKVSKGSSLTGE